MPNETKVNYESGESQPKKPLNEVKVVGCFFFHKANIKKLFKKRAANLKRSG